MELNNNLSDSKYNFILKVVFKYENFMVVFMENIILIRNFFFIYNKRKLNFFKLKCLSIIIFVILLFKFL